MIEIKKKARFITDFYGSAPAIGTLEVVLDWVNDKISESILSFADQIKKKGEKADKALERILSVFHRNEHGNPVIGNWMLHKCFTQTGKTIFNAMKDKTHPKQKIIDTGILPPVPIPFISIFNGKLIEKPNGIETYTVTLKNGRSFFKAYEYIKKGASFEFTASFDDNLISEEHFEQILNVCGRFGIGAFRERFGKFELFASN